MTDTQSNNNLRPPGFKKWSGWYTLVLTTLAFLIVLFYGIMRFFQ